MSMNRFDAPLGCSSLTHNTDARRSLLTPCGHCHAGGLSFQPHELANPGAATLEQKPESTDRVRPYQRMRIESPTSISIRVPLTARQESTTGGTSLRIISNRSRLRITPRIVVKTRALYKPRKQLNRGMLTTVMEAQLTTHLNDSRVVINCISYW